MADAAAILARLNADPELSRLMALPPPECPRGAALAAAGVPYRLAGRDVPPPAADHMLALGLIRSPLLTAAGEIGVLDAWRALYAITRGTAGLAPLVGLDGAIADVARTARDEGRDPAAAVAACSAAAWGQIDRAALALAAEYGHCPPQAVADLILAMLADVAAAWATVPQDEKKTAGHAGRTGIGWGGLWRWARGLAFRLARYLAARRWPWLAWLWPVAWRRPWNTRRSAATRSENGKSPSAPDASHGR